MAETFRSPELEAIARRWLQALCNTNGAMMRNLLSESEALQFVGSAPDEIYRDNVMRRMFADHVAAIPVAQIRKDTVDAWDSGEFGWAFLTCILDYPSTGKSLTGRMTLVFAMEQGIWKAQHIHNSIPSANLEAMGYEASGLEDLIKEAQASGLAIVKSGSATVMFTDIADSSALAETLADARWTGVVQRHVTMISDTLAGHDGRLVKSLGDGTMSTFSSAGAAMQTSKAIRTALAADTDEPRLQVRIGLHTGDVVEAGDDFFGTVVNKAARIAGVARPGEIRVSEATRIMVGGASDFTFADPASIPLKGLEGEHLIHRLEWRA